jgi:hypothetical protein
MGELRQGLVGRRVVREQEDRGCRERPRERGMADRRATGAGPLAVGLPGTRDQAAGGDERLDAGNAGDLLARRAPHAGEECAETGDGAHERSRHRRMAVGGRLDLARSRAEQRRVTVDQRQVPRPLLRHTARREALEASAAVLGRGDAAQGGAEVIRATGMLDGRLPLGPLVHAMSAAAQELARGPPLARVHIGLGHESAMHKRRDLVGIEAVLLGCAAGHRPPREGVSQHAGPPCGLAEIGQPGPGEQARDAAHHLVAEGWHSQEKRLGMGADVVGHAPRAGGSEAAEVQPVDVEVDAAGKRGRRRGKSHGVSSLLRGMGRHLRETGCASVCQQEEAFIIINPLQRTAHSAGF